MRAERMTPEQWARILDVVHDAASSSGTTAAAWALPANMLAALLRHAQATMEDEERQEDDPSDDICQDGWCACRRRGHQCTWTPPDQILTLTDQRDEARVEVRRGAMRIRELQRLLSEAQALSAVHLKRARDAEARSAESDELLADACEERDGLLKRLAAINGSSWGARLAARGADWRRR